MVMNVLYGYFDVKKNKLKWTGSLEDLKAFVLTLIDEETAEATTWRSPSGGKWIFESKPLVVTWQMKSENIYFEGEKSVALEEQIKTFMERSKLASGNNEPISECKQLLSDDSDLNEAVLNLSNVCDDGPSESDENSASNSKNYIAKNSVINQDKRGEDRLREECPKHTNSPDANSPDAKSPDANFPSRPSTMTETKEPFNPRGPVNAYSSYSTYDPEIIMLKSKFERLTEQVATRQDELAFEINVVKENKPYSIVTLEGVIDDLKKEKAELCRRNKELLESNISMRQTISQLNQTNKQLEEEKSSLVTAVKIIQNYFNQLSAANKASSKVGEEPGDRIGACGGNNANAWKKPKSKHRSKLPTLSTNSCESNKPKTDGIRFKNQYNILSDKNRESTSSSSDTETDDEPNKEIKKPAKETQNRKQKMAKDVRNKASKNNDGTDKKMTAVIVGDSMVKYLNAKRLKRSMPTGNQNIHVETYRGSTTEAMTHHIKPCLAKQPDQIVLHVGTNDVRDKQPKEIVDGIMKIQDIIKKESPEAVVAVSELIHRNDKAEYSQKVKKVNILLAKACRQYSCDYIEHTNIQDKHLNPYGLHLNKFGTRVMAKNFVNYFNTKYA